MAKLELEDGFWDRFHIDSTQSITLHDGARDVAHALMFALRHMHTVGGVNLQEVIVTSLTLPYTMTITLRDGRIWTEKYFERDQNTPVFIITAPGASGWRESEMGKIPEIRRHIINLCLLYNMTYGSFKPR